MRMPPMARVMSCGGRWWSLGTTSGLICTRCASRSRTERGGIECGTVSSSSSVFTSVSEPEPPPASSGSEGSWSAARGSGCRWTSPAAGSQAGPSVLRRFRVAGSFTAPLPPFAVPVPDRPAPQFSDGLFTLLLTLSVPESAPLTPVSFEAASAFFSAARSSSTSSTTSYVALRSGLAGACRSSAFPLVLATPGTLPASCAARAARVANSSWSRNPAMVARCFWTSACAAWNLDMSLASSFRIASLCSLSSCLRCFVKRSCTASSS
mmetsp:Transcript_41385/g.123677  ORF Transcript_41385/g.123677 Transcript_41385/m.123677 type:complete len:266 (-) Transcript_41385:771-1568(-)